MSVGKAAVRSAGRDARKYIREGGVDETAFNLGTAGEDRYAGQVADAAARQASQSSAAQLGPAANVSTQQSDEWRRQQQGLAGALNARMQGQGGPSVAELQMKQGLGQAVAAQRGQAAMATGANRALASREAGRNMASMGQNIAGQSAILRAQEQMSAEQQLGALSGQARGQDLDTANQNAAFQQQTGLQQGAFQQQTNLANQQANLAQQQMNDQMVSMYMAQGMSRDQAQLQAQMASEQLQAQNYQAQLAAAAGQAAKPGMGEQLVGSLGGAALMAGGLALASDERLKEDIEPAGEDIDEMLNALKAASWKYKDKAKDSYTSPTLVKDGTNYGVMAQDLEKTKIGATLVDKDSETGALRVKDYGNIGLILASLSRVNERLNELEGSSKPVKKEK